MLTVLIVYGVAMPYKISSALNRPFQRDIRDIPLPSMAVEASTAVYRAFTSDEVELSDIIKPTRTPKSWLQAARVEVPRMRTASGTPFRFGLPRSNVARPLLLFIVWVAGVIGFTLKKGGLGLKQAFLQKWDVAVPFDGYTTDLVSLGLFTLLGFWLNDAYGRSRKAIRLWQSSLRSKVDDIAIHFAIVCRPGSWHEGDRERIFSFLAALPYALKAHLRDSRDVSELDGILAEEDLEALKTADDMPRHCLNVLLAYVHSIHGVHEGTFNDKKSPMRASALTLMYGVWGLDNIVSECESLKKFPISSAFTVHLLAFAALWLSLLPWSLVGTQGLFSFSCLIPIGYSLIRIIVIGSELSDPFGFNEDDVDMDSMAEEIKDSLREVYQSTQHGPADWVKPLPYSRKMFQLMPKESALDSNEMQPTLMRSLRGILNNMVSVNGWTQLAVVVWSAIAVTLSYSLSFLLHPSLRMSARAWCSPITVSADVLADVGFALFFILSFRASGAVNRYEACASLLEDMRRELRSLAVEIVQIFKDGSWHSGDKERVIAHLAQFPLTFRKQLQGELEFDDKEGLLLPDDRERLLRSREPVEHILNLVHSYVLTMDSSHPSYISKNLDDAAPGPFSFQLIARVSNLRNLARKAAGVRRFPVSNSYINHQRIFTGVWLALLPLSMAQVTGFYTILWAPLISYGVLGLEAITNVLKDPYSTTKNDLPMDAICNTMSSDVLSAVASVDWGCDRHVLQSNVKNEPYLGYILRNGCVTPKYSLPFVESKEPTEYGLEDKVAFNGPHSFKERATTYAHLLRSVPWVTLAFTIGATALGVTISYFTRELNATNVTWWYSHVTVGASVAGRLSFAGK